MVTGARLCQCLKHRCTAPQWFPLPQIKTPPMNMDKMIEDVWLGNIDIDCRRIVLAQDKEGEKRYEGKG